HLGDPVRVHVLETCLPSHDAGIVHQGRHRAEPFVHCGEEPDDVGLCPDIGGDGDGSYAGAGALADDAARLVGAVPVRHADVVALLGGSEGGGRPDTPATAGNDHHGGHGRRFSQVRSLLVATTREGVVAVTR